MLVETHCHSSNFSPDARQSLADLLAATRARGFNAVVLTEHYDKNYFSDGSAGQLTPLGSLPEPGEWIFDLAQYRARVQAAQVSFPELLQGIEIGYRPALAADLTDFLQPFAFDQIIGSVHAMMGKDLGMAKGHPLYDLPKQEAYEKVLEAHLEMVTSPFRFQVMGHVDYLTRYAPYEDTALTYAPYADHFDALFKALIEREVALEINLRTRYKQFDRTGHDPGLMDPTILRRYRDLGGELITLAGDAHSPEDFGRFFPEARAELKTLGFQYGYYFQQGRPMRYAL